MKTTTLIDQLEPRQHLAADGHLQIKSVVGDNRGRVIVSFDEAGRNFSKNTVRVFTAGPDGHLGNADDIRNTAATLSYSPSTFRLTIRTKTDRNQVYRIRLEDTIRSVEGFNRLDGEFNGGSTLSGDGEDGGDYKFRSVRDISASPFLRMDTPFGSVKIKVYKEVDPTSASAFLDLVNGGKFDNIVVSRSVPNFVVQMGSMQLKGDGAGADDIAENTTSNTFGPTPRTMSNTRGTISFARGGPQGLASNQFFFNLIDNTGLDTSNPVFTPFAEVTSGMSAIDAMGTAQRVALVNPIYDNDPNNQPAGILQDLEVTATGLTDVPVQTLAGLETEDVTVQSTTYKVVTNNFVPKSKLIVIGRVAQLMRIVVSK